MYLCKICGREIPEARGLPWKLEVNSFDSGHYVTSLNDFPDIFWEICDVHLAKFAHWYFPKGIMERRLQAKRLPGTEDLAQWVETQISTLSARMQKGLPGGYCQCATTVGNRQCPFFAAGYIGGAMACSMHMKLHAKWNKISSLQSGKQPITEAVINLLGL